MGLPYGEEIVIVGRTMWTQTTSVTDGQTDGQTGRITITKTVQRRASHGKNDYCSNGSLTIVLKINTISADVDHSVDKKQVENADR